MKLYINEQNQIRAVRVNDTGNDALREIEVEDNFLQGYCDAVIKGYCYHMDTDDNGNQYVSVYPYKDYFVLESIQQQYEEDQKYITALQMALTEQYETNLALEEEVTRTQMALIEIYEGMGV